MKQTHYSVQVWVDFIRGLAPPKADRSALQSHLEACAACRRLVEELSLVAAAASQDRAAPVPVALTQAAKALFEPAPAARDWIAPLRNLVAKLVFDSTALAPQPVGVRSRGQSPAAAPRMLTFQAGNYDVDLHLEPKRGRREDAAEIVGQVARRAAPTSGVVGAVVQLIARGETVAETETNRFGEFMLSHPAAPSAVLRIAIREERLRFDLPLEPKSPKRN